MVVIESKHRKRENILKKYPDAVIADVTGTHAELGKTWGTLYLYLAFIL